MTRATDPPAGNSEDRAHKLKALFEEHYEDLSKYAYTLVRKRYPRSVDWESKTHDMLSIAFIRMRERDNYDPTKNFRFYFTGVVLLLILEDKRAYYREQGLPGRRCDEKGLSEERSQVLEDLVSRDLNPHELAVQAEEMESWLRLLKDKKKEELIRLFFKGLDWSEIASRTGCGNPKTAAIRCLRALEKLASVHAADTANRSLSHEQVDVRAKISEKENAIRFIKAEL